MQTRMLSWIVVLVGVVMIGSSFVQMQPTVSYAAPLRAVTPTAEPPTPTPTTPPTNTPLPTATLVPTAPPTATTVPATATPAPTNTAAPSRQPDTGRPDIAVVKSASQQSARTGDTVTFTLVVTNLGDAAADNVVASDNLPNGFDFIQVTTTRGTVTVIGRAATISIGTVQPGETVTITLVTTVNAAAQAGQVQNIALVSTTTLGDNPNNNTSTVSIDLAVPPVSATPSIAPSSVPTGVPVPTVATKPRTLPVTGASADWGMSLVLVGAMLIAAGVGIGLWRPRSQRG